MSPMATNRSARVFLTVPDRGSGSRASAARHTIVVIPAYNEARFIGSVVLQARQHASKVIVVDDGSTDDTASIAQAAGAELLQNHTNLGKAAALSKGFVRARKLAVRPGSPVKVVAVLDGDGQHQPAELPLLAAPILAGNADLVVGSRFLGVKSHIPRWRIFGQQALTLATNIGSGFRLTDSQSGFRAFSIQALQALDFEADGFSVESEMQFLAQEKGFRVVEVPIHAIYAEPAKRNPIHHGLTVVEGILKLVGQYRPMFYFGVPGVTLFLFGVGWGGLVVERFSETGHLAVGYAMICLLLSIMGMILISTGFTLHSIRDLMLDLLRKRRGR